MTKENVGPKARPVENHCHILCLYSILQHSYMYHIGTLYSILYYSYIVSYSILICIQYPCYPYIIILSLYSILYPYILSYNMGTYYPVVSHDILLYSILQYVYIYPIISFSVLILECSVGLSQNVDLRFILYSSGGLIQNTG